MHIKVTEDSTLPKIPALVLLNPRTIIQNNDLKVGFIYLFPQPKV